MSNVRRVAQRIRHTPGIEKVDPLWKLLRGPYHRFLNLSGRGVSVKIGGACPVRMPPHYCGGLWESYEPESIAAFFQWVKNHPSSLILDVGCAIGIYTLVGLFASENTEVAAFDPDWSSLRATQRICHYAKGSRLKLIRGFVSDEHQSGLMLADADSETQSVLQTSRISGDSGTTTYICIDGNTDSTIPFHSLDGLILNERPLDRPIFLKCDVEGAELLVLRGSRKLLEAFSPTMLISVHPLALNSYGHSVEDVRSYIQSAGYSIRILAIDHEEHWWCEKSPAQI